MSHSVLLVGLGQVAMGYDIDIEEGDVVLTHARAFASHPAFHIVGGVDPVAERRSMFTDRYQAPAQADLSVALREAEPDVVVIATPTENHAEALHTVLMSRPPKAVLCEKPLSYECAEARKMVSLSRAKECPLYVNYPRRVSPDVREVKCRLKDGRIAGPVKGVAWYTKGLIHSGSHLVNLLEFWLGPICDYDVLDAGRRIDAQDCEPDVRIKFAAGSVTLLAAREEDYSLHEIDLVASNGRLRYAQGGGKVMWQPAVVDALTSGYVVLGEPGEDISAGSQNTQWQVADQLAAALAHSDTDLCSGPDALSTIEWLIKMRDAL